MDVTVIYPKGNLGNTERRFDIHIDELPIDETNLEILERVWRVMNVVDGSDFELPPKLKCRSMSVGDIAFINGEYWMVMGCGWKQLEGHKKGQEYEWSFYNGC